MLRQLNLRYNLRKAETELETISARGAELDAEQAALEERANELTAATDEMTTETSQEDRDALEAQVAEYDRDREAYEQARSENEQERTRLNETIESLRAQIEEIDNREPAQQAQRGRQDQREERTIDMTTNNTRARTFREAYTAEQRSAMVQREDVKGFLTRLREMKGQTRAVNGAELLIPDYVLGLMRDNLNRYSKLLKHVNVKPVNGTSRINILGVVPEAVWMEVQGWLNELELDFAQVEFDGFMVGGFIPVHNTTLEDSDVNLFTEVFDDLGQSIGLALDKAILYGTGAKMPVGIDTRLVATSQPSWWDTNAPTFTDLHASHVQTVTVSGVTAEAFFDALIQAAVVADPAYGDDRKFWAMNRKTYGMIMGKAINFNVAGALVANVNHEMPIVGGAIEELSFIPDNVILGGYGACYILAERSGAKVESADQTLFLKNMTLFRGVARYDGKPVIGEAFVKIILGSASGTVDFAPDYANNGAELVVTAAAGTAAGDTVLTVTGTEASGTTLKYAVGDKAVHNGGYASGSGWAALTSGTTQITAAAGKIITVVELDGDGRIVKFGKVKSVPKT